MLYKFNFKKKSISKFAFVILSINTIHCYLAMDCPENNRSPKISNLDSQK